MTWYPLHFEKIGQHARGFGVLDVRSVVHGVYVAERKCACPAAPLSSRSPAPGRHWHRCGSTPTGPGDHTEDQRNVVYAPRGRADMGEELRRLLIVHDVPGARDPSGGRLEVGAPAEVGRKSDAGSRVASDVQCSKPGGKTCPMPARGCYREGSGPVGRRGSPSPRLGL